jgi:uncharacterized protein YqeY
MRRGLTAAMKARDRRAVAALRSTLAAIDNAEAVDATQAPPAGEGEIAGAALGVGAAEVERRTLTAAETEAIVRREVAERETAAQAYERRADPRTPTVYAPRRSCSAPTCTETPSSTLGGNAQVHSGRGHPNSTPGGNA